MAPRATPPLPGLRRASVRGRTIAYRRAGTGPPLVLLHGFASDSRIWRPQLATLSESFDVIAWDAIGAGASDDPPATYALHDWADDLDAFLDRLSIRRAHVLGLSWGSVVAQELYRRHRPRVRSLILADSYAGWRGSLGADVAGQRLAAALVDSNLAPAAFARRYLPSMSGSAPPTGAREMATILRARHPAGFRLMARALAEADTRQLLPAIDVPTLLLWGAEDVRSPVSVGEAFHRAIPGSRLVIIPEAGHASNVDRPEAFNAAVTEFFAGQA